MTNAYQKAILTFLCFCLFACQSSTVTTMRLPDSALHRIAVARVVDYTSERLGFTDNTEVMRRSFPARGEWIRAKDKPLGRYNGVRIWVGIDHDSISVMIDQLGRAKAPDYIAAEASLATSLRQVYPELKVQTSIELPH